MYFADVDARVCSFLIMQCSALSWFLLMWEDKSTILYHTELQKIMPLVNFKNVQIYKRLSPVNSFTTQDLLLHCQEIYLCMMFNDFVHVNP